MGTAIRLDDISFGDDEIDALFSRWREAIERANTWEVTGNVTFSGGPAGYAVNVKNAPGSITAVVATGGITARSGSTLGVGNAVLWFRSGASLVSSGVTVKVYSAMATAIVATVYIEVIPDASGDYKLLAADCP